ncbi:GNAT family N-acetyltransferase (plasmid) [Haloferacaceae archaeon DSL9]
MASAGEQETAEYTIRLYEPDDKDDFLSLFETVMGGGSEAWFDWKYVDNPYVSHVPMFVAEHDGEVVGTRPYLAFRVRAGDQTLLGLQTGDTMVHPDHRRRGLFTRMTTQSFDYYGSFEDPVLKFSIPNALSRPGYLKLGCRVVSQLTAYYRIQNPTAMVGSGPVDRINGVASSLVDAYYGARDRFAESPTEVTVTKEQTIPSRRFASLYSSAVPNRIHAVRDRAFYEWRFGNPEWEYTAYTASVDGNPVAGAVVGVIDEGGTTRAQLTEITPLVGDETYEDALEALLSRFVADHSDIDLLSVSGKVIPNDRLRRYGFYPDDRLPLSKVTTPTVLITRLLDGTDDPDWILNGHELLAPESWRLTYSEHNTS